MEPSLAKKAKQDLRHLTQDDLDVIRKLLAAFEKHLHREVEAELGRVKDVVNPTFRIFVNGIGISVSLDIIKVILILFNFNFLNLIFVLFRKSFHFFARSSMWKKFFLATSSLTQSYLPCSLTFCNPFRYTLLHANMKPAPSKKSKAGSLQPHPG